MDKSYTNAILSKMLESEEMQYYFNHFGGKKNPTQEKIKNYSKEQLEKETEAIINKTSKLSKKERDLVIYYFKLRQ